MAEFEAMVDLTTSTLSANVVWMFSKAWRCMCFKTESSSSMVFSPNIPKISLNGMVRSAEQNSTWPSISFKPIKRLSVSWGSILCFRQTEAIIAKSKRCSLPTSNRLIVAVMKYRYLNINNQFLFFTKVFLPYKYDPKSLQKE